MLLLTALPLDPESTRFRALQAHFVAAGCCGQCATYWAISAVEREARRTDMVERPVCKLEGACEVRMRASWGTRPARGEQQRRAA